MDTITYDDFAKIEIRMGTVLVAEVPEGSRKLIKYTVDFGDFGQKVIFSGIKDFFEPQELVGKQLPFIVNLPEKKMGELGISQGMLLAASPETETGHGCMLMVPETKVTNGTRVI